ncbi:MAG TPA: YtxH domain-containing protein [Chitinophagaceae bacterium]|jgi:gas vesicle protein
MKNSSKVLIALTAGVAIGGALGLLFAPDKGSATRKKIKYMADDFADNVKERIAQGKDKLADLKSELEDPTWIR